MRRLWTVLMERKVGMEILLGWSFKVNARENELTKLVFFKIQT